MSTPEEIAHPGYAVIVDGWQLDCIKDTAEEAAAYAAYCNRHYLGHHTWHLAKADTASRFMAAIAENP